MLVCALLLNCSFARMPVGRTRKGKLAAAIARHSIAASVVSDEDGNASECGESTLGSNPVTVNAAYNNQQQQQSNELKCTSNNSQCSDEDDQNQNDANNLNLNGLDLTLSNGENVACQ